MNSPHEHYLHGFLAATGQLQDQAPSGPDPAGSGEPASPANLSWEEQTKREIFPFDAFPRLLDCVRQNQPPSAADRFRFQWFGLFYQGPEQDAFLARLRLPGGRVQAFQWRELAQITQELAGGCVEFNSQGGLDLPGVPVRAGVELLRRLEGIGLSARGTGGDCVQAVRGGERENLPAAESPPVYGLVCELEQTLAQSRAYGDLPGGCEVWFRAADKWSPVPGQEAVANDPPRLVFQACPPTRSELARPAGWPFVSPTPEADDWRILLPGGDDLEVSLPPAETVPVCLALLRGWTRQANRASREQASLANFCAALGTGTVRDLVESELGRKLARSPLPAPPSGPVSTLPIIPVPGGRLLSGQMAALGDWAAQQQTAEIRVVSPPGVLVLGDRNAPGFEADFRAIFACP